MSAFRGKADMTICGMSAFAVAIEGKADMTFWSANLLKLVCERLDAFIDANWAALVTGGWLERLSAMPQPRKYVRVRPPIGERRCPLCGVPMFLSHIEPSQETGHDERTFECSLCAYAETAGVKFR
jgi:hypothetical protein